MNFKNQPKSNINFSLLLYFHSLLVLNFSKMPSSLAEFGLLMTELYIFNLFSHFFFFLILFCYLFILEWFQPIVFNASVRIENRKKALVLVWSILGTSWYNHCLNRLQSLDGFFIDILTSVIRLWSLLEHFQKSHQILFWKVFYHLI